jgi:hypothetical protein
MKYGVAAMGTARDSSPNKSAYSAQYLSRNFLARNSVSLLGFPTISGGLNFFADSLEVGVTNGHIDPFSESVRIPVKTINSGGSHSL